MAFDTSISLAGGDSISSSGLQFKGKIKVGDVSFLKRVPGIKFAPMLSLNINEVPLAYSLEQNYPNPFNPTTAIGFSLLAVGNVTLKIYDILGREVATLLNNEKMEAGRHEIQFDGSTLTSGVYFYRLSVDGKFSETKKLVLMK